MKVGEPLPAEIAGAGVLDATGARTQLGELLAGRSALLLFVRHFGCIGCAQQIALLSPRLVELEDLELDVVIIGCGRPDHITDFVDRFELDHERVTVVTDPSLELHQVAGLERGAWSAYSPRSFFEAARAWSRGHRGRGRQGASTQQGGAILVDGDGVVRYLKRSLHLGDPVDVGDVVEIALGSLARARRPAGLI